MNVIPRYLNTSYSFVIYHSAAVLPAGWDNLCRSNIFLCRRYLEALERSAPDNMICHYIGLFEGADLIGIALSQFLDLNRLESFGERDKCVKTTIRNFIFKRFSSHVLFIGNNMLTGQNAFSLREDANAKRALVTLREASARLESEFERQGKKIHLITFKDFDQADAIPFSLAGFGDYLKFTTQPNMVLEHRADWRTFDDYLSALSKKYRDQYKRARKKAAEVEKRKMSLEEIVRFEPTINELYRHVAVSAPFNTFFLSANHFRALKESLGEDFLLYGYFSQGKLIGFNTLIRNGDVLDTYFLGYDDSVQREHMLYLNMLYDMIAYSINNGFKKIVFARTALEIKSSVGAKPQQMFGFMRHSNRLVNKNLSSIFGYLEPATDWQQRHPFKEAEPSHLG